MQTACTATLSTGFVKTVKLTVDLAETSKNCCLSIFKKLPANPVGSGFKGGLSP